MERPSVPLGGTSKRWRLGGKMPRAVFNRRVHYLDIGFKRALRDYRWRWLVPEELDRKTNPILRHLPDAFDRVLSPFELDGIIESIRGSSRSLYSTSNLFFELGASGENPYWEEAYNELCSIAGKDEAPRLDSIASDFFRMQLDTYYLSSDDQKAIEAGIQEEWKMFPGPTDSAQRDDLGESDEKETIPWVMPLDTDFWKNSKNKRPGITECLPQQTFSPWKGAKKQFLVYLHPFLSSEEIDEMLFFLGVKKKTGGRSRGVIADGEIKLRALRWWICRWAARDLAKDRGWGFVNIDDIIANEINGYSHSGGWKPETIASWWKSDGGPLKTARAELGLALQPSPIPKKHPRKK